MNFYAQIYIQVHRLQIVITVEYPKTAYVKMSS